MLATASPIEVQEMKGVKMKIGVIDQAVPVVSTHKNG